MNIRPPEHPWMIGGLHVLGIEKDGNIRDLKYNSIIAVDF